MPSPLLRELFKAATKGLASLKTCIEQHKREISSELATEAYDAYVEASENQQFVAAQFLAVVAKYIHLAIGQPREALSRDLDFQQALFMKAETTEAYQQVHDATMVSVATASQISATDVAFQAYVQAANSAFFAAQTSYRPTNDGESKGWLLVALRDIAAACDRAQDAANDVLFAMFVDRLAAITDQAMTKHLLWNNEEAAEVQGLLLRLALAVDMTIPSDFEFPGNPSKTNRIAQVFAKLSSEYGR